MSHGASTSDASTGAEWLVLLIVVVPLLAYVTAAEKERRGRRDWNSWRTISFAAGVALLALAVSPPMAEFAHRDLRGHMIQHLLVGMFAPLGLALAAPVTLLLRSVPVATGRTIASILRSKWLHLLAHPVTALALNLGAIYVLYLTPLYRISLSNPPLHFVINLHFFAAGYLFVWSVAGPDPAPRRPAMPVRIVALAAAMASHSMLGKLMYAHLHPRGTPFDADEIRDAAELMYYGGDMAELLLAVALFATWFHARRRIRVKQELRRERYDQAVPLADGTQPLIPGSQRAPSHVQM